MRLFMVPLLFLLPMFAMAIPPKPTLSGDAPWTKALPMERNSEFTQSTVGGAKVVVDSRLGWMWAPPSAKKLEWYDAHAYCDSLVYAGYSDWQLPSFWQLRSIVDSNRHGYFVYPVFTQVKTDHILWSRDDSIAIDQPDFDDRWALFMNIGLFTFEEREQEFNAMCVRGKDPVIDAPSGSNRFVEVSPDLIQDQRSGLFWTGPRDRSKSSYYMFTVIKTQQEAREFCTNLSFGGKTDWRLPNVQELISIMQPNVRYPATTMMKLPDAAVPIWSDNVVDETGYAWMVQPNGQAVAGDNPKSIFGCVHE
jgi:hypothetical protein